MSEDQRNNVDDSAVFWYHAWAKVMIIAIA